jgi:hypothetical protein
MLMEALVSIKKKKKKKKKLWNTLKHMKRYIYAQETTGKR